MRLSIAIGLALYLLNACVTMSAPHNQFQNGKRAEEALLKDRACPGCDLRKAELAYTDLRGVDLRGANLKGADFSHADLREAKLRGAILARADLSTAVQLEGADLRDADLLEANVAPSQLNLARTCRSRMPDGHVSTLCAPQD